MTHCRGIVFDRLRVFLTALMHFPMTRKGSNTGAIRLLKRVLASGWFDRNYLATRLAVRRRMLDAHLWAEVPMPLERQLRLAAFVIENVPPLARAGYRLRSQVSAAMTHESPA